MEKLTIKNNESIFNRLKDEIVKDISSREDKITLNFNGEDITLPKIF